MDREIYRIQRGFDGLSGVDLVLVGRINVHVENDDLFFSRTFNTFYSNLLLTF